MIREIWAALKRWWCMPLPMIAGLDLSVEPLKRSGDLPAGHEPKADEVVFAVTARPRHIPWSIRKRELEQEARQKRRAREEFREQA